MRVVISVDGGVFVLDLDARRVEGHASVAETLTRDGCEIGAVVGDGGITRGYIGAAHDLDANEVRLDQIGISVIRTSARLFIAILGPQVDPKVVHGYEDAGDVIRCGDISVMSGVMPGQTANAVAATLAKYVDADLFVCITGADGVFSADPNSDPDATEFKGMTAAGLVDVIGDIEMDAGSSTPVDLLAAKLIERARMRTTVLDGTNPDRIAPAVLHSEYTGTDIIPEGGNELIYWTL